MWDFLFPALGAVGQVISTKMTNDAITQGNKDAIDAGNKATEASNARLDASLDQIRTDNEPWRKAGAEALNGKYGHGGLVNFDANNPDFSMADFNADPGHNFRLSEGMKAVERSSIARGKGTAATAQALMKYNQDLGTQDYGNARDAYYSRQNTKRNALQSLAGLGQTAVQMTGQAGQNTAGAMSNNLMSNGREQAGGLGNIGYANGSAYQGYGSALKTALDTYNDQGRVNALRNQ